MAGYVNDLEETGIIGVLDYVDPTFAAVERYGPPVIAGTLVSDGLRMLDDFARETVDTLARRWTMSARSYEAYSTKSSEVDEREEDVHC